MLIEGHDQRVVQSEAGGCSSIRTSYDGAMLRSLCPFLGARSALLRWKVAYKVQ